MLKELYESTLIGPWSTIGDDVQYRIETNLSSITLHLQGSVSKRDWLNNFNFPAIPYKRMEYKWYAHRGFINMWKSARDKIIGEIQQEIINIQEQSKVESITVVGYSQGAALSVLAHEDIYYTFPELQSVLKTYTFAGPRVFWFPNKVLKERLYNILHIGKRGDIVTYVPPSIFGFTHCYKKQKIGKWKFPWWINHLPEKYITDLTKEE